MMKSIWRVALMVVAVMMVVGCKEETKTPPSAGKRKVKIGFVAKSQSNTVFQVAHAGAKAAGKKLGPQYGVEVEVDIRTPPAEDAVKQAEAVDSLVRAGAAGIAVACSDAGPLTPAINRAVEAGVAVMCFDSDAPASKRFCYYGTDDIACGQKVMALLAKFMGEKGTVAILAGNASAPNLQKRVEGVRQELKKYPNMRELNDGKGVFFHAENPSDAAEAWKTATRTNPAITGWALVGGWPLFVKGAVDWDPAKIKVVAVDALPAQLEYLESGAVQMLLAQDCYGWGTESVELLLEKIVNKKEPEGKRVIDPLKEVTKANAKEVGGMWTEWLGGK